MGNFVLLILDSLGVGELPDAKEYGDRGSNTLGNIATEMGGLNLPNLEELGLGNVIPVEGVTPQNIPTSAWGKMAEVSPGKDTTTGHWELAGIQLTQPFPTYPEGFPADLIEQFTTAIKRPIIGNVAASGTAIIDELGADHLKTGSPIIYTSADSVFQIAAHEDVVPLEQLYKWCKIAREILTEEHAVGRVIARPFVGEPGNFTRTTNRRDYSLEPIGTTILDYLTTHRIDVNAIGKINDVFAGRGISKHLPAKNNTETINQTITAISENRKSLIFANLVDFDMLWGHRNDVAGYAKGLEEFDKQLPQIIAALKPEDVLCITADHGCDPTTKSTDHSREYVPLLVYGQQFKAVALGTRKTFSDVAQTIAEYFSLDPVFAGESFYKDLTR